jgi:hypothetical protein
MLEKVETLQGYKLRSLDGDIGKVREFYFDDRYWTIRYLVADTGNWLSGRQVLISPYALGDVIHERREVAVSLTKAQIETSPSLANDQPVSRQYEDSYYGFFGWPTYWGGPYMWGAYPRIARAPEQWNVAPTPDQGWDPNLRSTKDVTGHHIEASDGEIGHVSDFLIDPETWEIRYLIVDTRNWWPGKSVLLSPHWIERVSWADAKVHVNLTRDEIHRAPAYPAESSLTREYETQLHHHYNRQGYWIDEPIATGHTL